MRCGSPDNKRDRLSSAEFFLYGRSISAAFSGPYNRTLGCIVQMPVHNALPSVQRIR